MDFLKLTESSLSVDDIMKLVSSEKCGAVSIFVGTTRDNFEGKMVKSLEYEAYESMAIKVMKDICNTIRSKWKEVYNIAIYHRLGTVGVMETSIIIAISSPHRVEALAAVQYCIENLKVSNLNLVTPDNSCIFDSLSVQIKASHDEMFARIQKYTERKRDEVNINNIKDFIYSNSKQLDDNLTTCARVDAILLKSKDSKGHLKVKRTENEWGPQTKIIKLENKNNLMHNMYNDNTVMNSIEERISNVEEKVCINKPLSGDIYRRLKRIEDKISQLESLSPEYFMFWTNQNSVEIQTQSGNASALPCVKKIKYTSEDIWNKIKEMEKQ